MVATCWRNPMNSRHLTMFLLLAGAIFCATARAQQADANVNANAAGRILVGGSGSWRASLRLVAQAFGASHPEASVVIVPGLGSDGGLHALRARAIDLAVISRPLKEEERKPDILAVEHARSPFVFAASPRTKVAALAMSDLPRLYRGELATWPDGSPLRLVLRAQFSPDTELLKSLSPAMNQAVQAAMQRPGMRLTYDDAVNADVLEKVPGTLGTITLAQIISEKRGLQALALDGVAPSVAALMQGRYPYYKSMVLVSRADASPLTRQFIGFLRSPAGRDILEANGHWVASTK